MPEGPELYLASRYINRVCAGLVFSGRVEKSDVSKNPAVPFESASYRISAVSRGKEIKLSLLPVGPRGGGGVDVVFRFGMSGCFKLSPAAELPKHAHLRFYTRESPRRALCFVDTRRFGSWEAPGAWQPQRGPCVMQEYEKFRENVLRNLSQKVFDRPICEALLNQKYFNGIGNYLRAEILYRLKIPPFVKARTVLDPLLPKDEGADLTLSKKLKIKKENPDLLELCHSVPMEAIHIGGEGYYPTEKEDFSVYASWLQCYFVPGMKTLQDSTGRTVWFQGEAGPLAPKATKSKTKRRGVKADPESPSPKVIKSETQEDSTRARTQAGSTRRGNKQKDKLGRKRSRESEIKAEKNAKENGEKQVNLKTRKKKLPSQDLPENNPPTTKRKGRLGQRVKSPSVSLDSSRKNPPATKRKGRQTRRAMDISSLIQDSSENPPATGRMTRTSILKGAGSSSKARRSRRGNAV